MLRAPELARILLLKSRLMGQQPCKHPRPCFVHQVLYQCREEGALPFHRPQSRCKQTGATLVRAQPALPPALGERPVRGEMASGTRRCAGARPRCHAGEDPRHRSARRGRVGPQSPGKSRRPLRQRCRALGGAGAAALPWFGNSSESRAAPRGARPWDPDLPKITHSPPHAAASRGQPRHTRSARGAEEFSPAAPRGETQALALAGDGVTQKKRFPSPQQSRDAHGVPDEPSSDAKS